MYGMTRRTYETQASDDRLSVVGVLAVHEPAANAQGVGASGGIAGTVTDPSGAVIPRASVVAEETSRGTRIRDRN